MAASLTVPFSQELNQVFGQLRATIFDVVLATNDYVTNGIDLSSFLPSGDFVGAVILGTTGAGAGVGALRPHINITTKKLMLFEGAAGDDAEEGNGASDAVTVRVLAFTA